jgi:hypothetical protein
VKTLTNKTFIYKGKVSDTLTDVKVKISDELGLPSHISMIMVFEGKQLDDDSTLAGNNLIRDSTLWMVFIVFVCINII